MKKKKTNLSFNCLRKCIVKLRRNVKAHFRIKNPLREIGSRIQRTLNIQDFIINYIFHICVVTDIIPL